MTIVDKASEKSDFESAQCNHSSSLTPVAPGGVGDGSSSWSVDSSTAELSRTMATCVAPSLEVAVYGGNTALPAERPNEQGKYLPVYFTSRCSPVMHLVMHGKLIKHDCSAHSCSGLELWRWHHSAPEDPVSIRASQLEMDPSPPCWSRSPEPGQHMFSEFSSSVSFIHCTSCQLYAVQRAFQNM